MPEDQITDAKDLLKQVSDFGERMKERRQFERKKLLWAATVEVRGQRFEGMIVDLSAGGARIKFDAPVTAGDELTLMLKQLDELGAKVVWQREGEAGLKFLLAPDEVAAKLQDKMALDLKNPGGAKPAAVAAPTPAAPAAPPPAAAGATPGKRRTTLIAAAVATSLAALIGGSLLIANAFSAPKGETVALVVNGGATDQHNCSALMDKIGGATNQVDFSLHVASAVQAKCLDMQHLGPSDDGNGRMVRATKVPLH
jgi:hypothetical protein